MASEAGDTLHVRLGPIAKKRLEEILEVTEENRSGLTHRLIREEWLRQRANFSPRLVDLGGPALLSADDVADQVTRNEIAERQRILAEQGTDDEGDR